MVTEILSGSAAVARGAKIIKNGGLVAFPTETVYGLGGNALRADTIEQIYAAKGRPSDNPLIVHVADIKDIAPLVSEISDLHIAVAKAFMPGPITLLFNKSDTVPDAVTAGLKTVAIRIPAHPIARELIALSGVPIAAPSANRSTHISPTTAKHVYDDLNGRIPMIIDGGSCAVGIESTVLDLSGAIPTILRPGAITADMLVSVIGSVKTHEGEVIQVAKAPGMKYKHYAPQIPMVISSDINKIIAEYDNQRNSGLNPVIIAGGEQILALTNKNYINLGANIEEVCTNIYAALHDAETNYDYILCFDYGEDGLAASVMNRVIKAAGGKRL